MTFVKICGLTDATTLKAAAGADAVGFVVASPQSHRNLPLHEARILAEQAGPFRVSVAVTAERDPAALLGIVQAVRPHAIQVPFRAGQAAFALLRARFPLLRLLAACRPEDAHLLPDEVDAIVLDAAAQDGYGGTGQPTDWPRARQVCLAQARPVILAGGLTPANVADAIRLVRPYGVDVSSGVETDKRKDPGKIQAFVEAAKEVKA